VREANLLIEEEKKEREREREREREKERKVRKLGEVPIIGGKVKKVEEDVGSNEQDISNGT
jgi:hypothetical protein